MQPGKTPSVLAVFAHPDDEAFLAGGTLARLALSGAKVRLLCLTYGEGGLNALKSGCEARELARTRQVELTNCCRMLGVSLLPIAGVPDGQLGQYEPGRLATLIGLALRYYRPSLVLTFGPDGLTGHPDHLAVHRATTLAFEQNACPGSVLLYSSLSEQVVNRLSTRLEGELDGLPLYLQGLPEASLPISVDIRRTAGLKWAALACHHTQAAGFTTLTHDDRRILGQREFFQVARVAAPQRSQQYSL